MNNFFEMTRSCMKFNFLTIFTICSIFMGSINLNAMSFEEAVKKLENHESVDVLKAQAIQLESIAGIKGSWGDPQLRVSAKNFPKDSLKDDQTPMTGIGVGISQKVALTNKYGKIANSYKSLAKAASYHSFAKKEILVKELWELLIVKRKIVSQLKILNENNLWISKILKVSKRLYSTGKASQQALLDIQIRKSEIETQISNKKYELSQIKDGLIYLLGDFNLAEQTIPWDLLNLDSNKIKDFNELELKEKINAKDFALTASKLNYVPDVTIAFEYTKRSNIDDQGDFVGATISFPLPFSDEKFSNHKTAVNDKYMALKQYEYYKRSKLRNISIIEKEILSYKNELEILELKTIAFAKNSREITSKSYGLGNSTYVELLQSELQLQKILMHKVELEEKRDLKTVSLKYLKGEPLNE